MAHALMTLEEVGNQIYCKQEIEILFVVLANGVQTLYLLLNGIESLLEVGKPQFTESMVEGWK